MHIKYILYFLIVLFYINLTGCVSYSTVDSNSKQLLKKRDSIVREGIKIWRSQLNSESNGGLVVLSNLDKDLPYSIRYQGDSVHNMSETIKYSDRNSICIWFWKEGIPLATDIYFCNNLLVNANYKLEIANALGRINMQLKNNSLLVRKLQESSEELRAHYLEISNMIDIVEQKQLFIKEVADSSVEYSKLLVGLLEEIEQIAVNQHKQLTDLASSKE